MAKPTRCCNFIDVNERPEKPRTYGLTEIRGPYYTVMGPRYFQVGWSALRAQKEVGAVIHVCFRDRDQEVSCGLR